MGKINVFLSLAYKVNCKYFFAAIFVFLFYNFMHISSAFAVVQSYVKYSDTYVPPVTFPEGGGDTESSSLDNGPGDILCNDNSQGVAKSQWLIGEPLLPLLSGEVNWYKIDDNVAVKVQYQHTYFPAVLTLNGSGYSYIRQGDAVSSFDCPRTSAGHVFTTVTLRILRRPADGALILPQLTIAHVWNVRNTTQTPELDQLSNIPFTNLGISSGSVISVLPASCSVSSPGGVELNYGDLKLNVGNKEIKTSISVSCNKDSEIEIALTGMPEASDEGVSVSIPFGGGNALLNASWEGTPFVNKKINAGESSDIELSSSIDTRAVGVGEFEANSIMSLILK
ncbi:hypothetical protein ACN2W4_12055 [Serratia marcescens]|uniref:hypothetical protein n=1 Tax=Serratia marcescens TaxID=615 RepID=UPI0039EB4035